VDDRAARALVRVQGMLGPEAVAMAVMAGGRSPAEQTRLVPWGDPRPPVDDNPPWPGRVPPPSPATVHAHSLPAELVDAVGAPVAVGSRGSTTAEPARLSIDGGRWAEVVGWAGPWPVEERWWDTTAHRRRARWQLLTADGGAHLLSVEGGRWSVEATYD